MVVWAPRATCPQWGLGVLGVVFCCARCYSGGWSFVRAQREGPVRRGRAVSERDQERTRAWWGQQAAGPWGRRCPGRWDVVLGRAAGSACRGGEGGRGRSQAGLCQAGREVEAGEGRAPGTGLGGCRQSTSKSSPGGALVHSWAPQPCTRHSVVSTQLAGRRAPVLPGRWGERLWLPRGPHLSSEAAAGQPPSQMGKQTGRPGRPGHQPGPQRGAQEPSLNQGGALG